MHSKIGLPLRVMSCWLVMGIGIIKALAAYDNPTNFMPPNLAWVDPWQGEVDSANQLAMLVGNDPLPDVHIARIPVNTTAELSAVIAKIKAYEQTSAQAWQKHWLFVADQYCPTPQGILLLCQ